MVPPDDTFQFKCEIDIFTTSIPNKSATEIAHLDFYIKVWWAITFILLACLGHSNLISCCSGLNFLHLALENENLFLEILCVILDHVTICRLARDRSRAM